MATLSELQATRAKLQETLDFLAETPEQGFSEEGSQVQYRKIEEIRKEIETIDRKIARMGNGRRRTVGRMCRNAS